MEAKHDEDRKRRAKEKKQRDREVACKKRVHALAAKLEDDNDLDPEDAEKKAEAMNAKLV